MTRPTPDHRNDYAWFLPIQTRWTDNDVYGHINNAVYYFYFDAAVNAYLIQEGALVINGPGEIGLVVDTGCSYFAPAAFPDTIHAGLRVTKTGTSSVRFEVGIFKNDDPLAVAQGHFVHVYVDEQSRKPAALSDNLKAALRKIEKAAPNEQ